MRILVFLLIAFSMYGCTPFPIQEIREYRITVEDRSGNPIQNAKLYFAKRSISLVTVNEMMEFQSNEQGHININGKVEWQLVFLAPDGATLYDWGWCIEKNGYIPVVENNLRNAPKENPITIVLDKGDMNAKCTWDDRYFFKYRK